MPRIASTARRVTSRTRAKTSTGWCLKGAADRPTMGCEASVLLYLVEAKCLMWYIQGCSSHQLLVNVPKNGCSQFSGFFAKERILTWTITIVVLSSVEDFNLYSRELIMTPSQTAGLYVLLVVVLFFFFNHQPRHNLMMVPNYVVKTLNRPSLLKYLWNDTSRFQMTVYYSIFAGSVATFVLLNIVHKTS